MVSVAGFRVDSAAAGGSKMLECIERFLVVCVFRTGFRRCFCLWFPLRFVMVSVTFVYGFRRWIFGGFCRRRRIQNLEGIERFLVLLFLGLVSVAVSLWFPSWQERVFMVSSLVV